MTIKEFLISPILWTHARREHSYCSTASPISQEYLRVERDNLVEAYNRTWKYFWPTTILIVCAAVIMGAVVFVAAVLLLLAISH